MKRSKIILTLIIILVILLIIAVGGLVFYNYYINNNNKETKENFYKYAFQNNFEKIFEKTSFENVLKKLNNNSYEATTQVEFKNSLLDTPVDLNKLTLEVKKSSDKENNNSSIKFMYSNNEIFKFNIIDNNKYIGIKNDDVLKNYIAIEKQNANTILSKIDENFASLYKNSENLKQNVKLTKNDNNIFSNNIEYIELFKKYITSTEYADEGTAYIEQNDKKIETNIYSLTMSKDEFINIFSAISEKIVDDENIINSIIAKESNLDKEQEIEEFESVLNFKEIVTEEERNEVHAFRESDATQNTNIEEKNYSLDVIEENDIIKKYSDISKNLNEKISNFEEYKKIYNSIKYLYAVSSNIGIDESKDQVIKNLNEIFDDLNKLLEEKIDDNSKIKIVTYVSKNETVKTTILIGKDYEIDIEYIDKLSTKITLVEKSEENYNGYSISIIKNKTNILESNIIEIDIIKDTNIISKLELKLSVEGSENSNKYDNTFNLLYSGNEGNFSVNFANIINFKELEIKILNEENALLVDNLEEKEFNYTINNINSRLQNVYNEKLSKMNLVNTNSSDRVIENNQVETLEENGDEKENIKEVLINAVSNEMGRFINEGKQYTIENLKELQIEGYEIQVSVSQDLAIVNINGYKFKIDKDFNLSE